MPKFFSMPRSCPYIKRVYTLYGTVAQVASYSLPAQTDQASPCGSGVCPENWNPNKN